MKTPKMPAWIQLPPRWRCSKCGYVVHLTRPPESCPSCTLPENKWGPQGDPQDEAEGQGLEP